jgi:hypothetical protein
MMPAQVLAWFAMLSLGIDLVSLNYFLASKNHLITGKTQHGRIG